MPSLWVFVGWFVPWSARKVIDRPQPSIWSHSQFPRRHSTSSNNVILCKRQVYTHRHCHRLSQLPPALHPTLSACWPPLSGRSNLHTRAYQRGSAYHVETLRALSPTKATVYVFSNTFRMTCNFSFLFNRSSILNSAWLTGPYYLEDEGSRLFRRDKH